MRQALSKSILITTLVVLSACKKGGGSDNKPAAVAQIPGPQGRVLAQNDGNTFCDFTNGSLICYSNNPNNTSQQCNSGTRNYSNIVTLCRELIAL